MADNAPTPILDKPLFKRLEDVRGLDLMWEQPSIWREAYELKAGEDTLATLVWDGTFKTSVTVESAEGRLHLAQEGFWKQFIVVTDDAGAELIRFEYHHGKNTIRLPDERVLTWKGLSAWRDRWAYLDENQIELIRIEMGVKGFLRAIGKIHLGEGSERLPLALLLALGWFLHLLYQRESAAAASATIAAAG